MIKRIVEREAPTALPLLAAKAANKARLEREAEENRASAQKRAGATQARIVKREIPPVAVAVPPTKPTSTPTGPSPSVKSNDWVFEGSSAQEVALRFIEAKKRDGATPHLREISAAAVEMARHLTNGQVGQRFGFGYSSGAVWASQVVSMRRIPEDVWKVIDEGALRRGKMPSVPWLARISRQSPDTQLEMVRSWAGPIST